MNHPQERYEAHQAQKSKELALLIAERHSHRMFDKTPPTEAQIKEMLDCCKAAPNSCDRHGVGIRMIADRDRKELLGAYLVGGVGWIHRAPMIFMLWAEPGTYLGDNGNEWQYNAYLDAGVMLGYLALKAESLGLHGTVVNPNVRGSNECLFRQCFAPCEKMKEPLYCGAFAFGLPHPDSPIKERNPIETLVI